MAARQGRDASAPLPAAVATLLRQGLLAPPVLVLGDPAVARALARRGLEARAATPRPNLDGLVAGGHATVLDLGWLARVPDVRRRAALRELARAVTPGGTLHVLAARGSASLRGLGRQQWALLSASEQGLPDGTWLLTFVHTAPPRRPRRAVRHFTDLGPFSSLDLGSPT